MQTQAVQETIGWVALTIGTGTTNDSPYIVDMKIDAVHNGVGQTEYIIDLSAAGFTALPDVIVSLIGENGRDGAYARGSGTYTMTQQGVYAEEGTRKEDSRWRYDEKYAIFIHLRFSCLLTCLFCVHFLHRSIP